MIVCFNQSHAFSFCDTLSLVFGNNPYFKSECIFKGASFFAWEGVSSIIDLFFLQDSIDNG